MIKIDFEFDSQFGVFRDAIYYQEGSYTEAEIEALKQQRFDNWLAIVSAPPVEEITTQEITAEGV